MRGVDHLDAGAGRALSSDRSSPSGAGESASGLGLRARLPLVVILVLIVPLGVATKLYEGPGEVWIRGHAGGLLYVLFWSLAVLALRPRLSPYLAAGMIFGLTCALEFLQLWNPGPLDRFRSTLMGQALIGSSFSWADFPWYAAGALSALGASALCRPKAARARSDRVAPG